MSTAQQLAIGIDLGGTHIKGALLESATGTLVRTCSVPTGDGEWSGLEPLFAHRVRDLVHGLEAIAGGRALAVGLCAPGIAHAEGRYIDWMPGRMQGLEKFDWPAFLEREVRVLNDAHAALLGEAWVGSAQGCEDVIMLTLGTAVGGAILSGGKLLRGHIGRGGHLGHISLHADGEPDAFKTPGSLDSFLGNRTLLQRTEGHYDSTEALVSAALAGESQAQTVWDTSVRRLAVAVASLINVLDPERVILGGGIAAGAGDRLLTPLQAYLDQYEWRPGGHRVRLMLASAGEWAGAIGSVRELTSTRMKRLPGLSPAFEP
jgi:glucokinase